MLKSTSLDSKLVSQSQQDMCRLEALSIITCITLINAGLEVHQVQDLSFAAQSTSASEVRRTVRMDVETPKNGVENLGGSVVVFSKSIWQEENYLSPQNTAGGVMAEALANFRFHNVVLSIKSHDVVECFWLRAVYYLEKMHGTFRVVQ